MLWDLAEGKRLYQLDAGDIIHALTFSPNRYWLCAATSTSIKVRGVLGVLRALCVLCWACCAALCVLCVCVAPTHPPHPLKNHLPPKHPTTTLDLGPREQERRRRPAPRVCAHGERGSERARERGARAPRSHAEAVGGGGLFSRKRPPLPNTHTHTHTHNPPQQKRRSTASARSCRTACRSRGAPTARRSLPATPTRRSACLASRTASRPRSWPRV